MSEVLVNQKKVDEALLSFKKANYNEAIKILKDLKQQQSHYIIYWYLAHSYFRISDYSSAIYHVQKSIELKKPDKLNLSFLAEIYLQANRYEDSINTFQEILKIDNNNINALFNLGKINIQIGNIEKAEKIYNKIIEIDSLNLATWYELIKINKKYLTLNLIEIAKKNINSEYLNNVYSELILAEESNLKKKFDNEISHLIAAHTNFLKKKQKAVKQEMNYFSNLLPQFINKIRDLNFVTKCDAKPIFILGLPRSGTTMIENIIARGEKKIQIGGETEAFSKIFFSKSIITNYDDKKLISNFDFSKESFELLKENIINQYNQQGLNINGNIFTDKSLENFLYIDLIIKVFPNAKFVYCKRNKVANLLGILKVFLPNLLWSHSVDNIVSMMNLYNNKLEQVISNNNIKLKIIELEKFTENPKMYSKNLYKFLELEWNEEILRSNLKTEHKIKTVSNIQVRNKINKHELSYLDNYIPILKQYGIDDLI